MGNFIENEIVSMEWEKNLWLQTSARGGRAPIFIVAAKNYTNASGEEISVMFNSSSAFLFIDDVDTDSEDIWSAEDLISTVKSSYDSTFPFNYEQFVPIINPGDSECRDYVLEKYGLTAYKDDIEKRKADLEPYGIEREIDLS